MMTGSAISRRGFIKVASATGAGLVLGFTLPAKWHPALLGESDAGDFAPNAWLAIDHAGQVTITVAKSEMGQGVWTALPMIVAEELDADWPAVRIVQAVADKKYGGMGTGGSTSVRTSWDMLRKAGATARAMLVQAAAETWSVDAASCATAKGVVTHTPTGRMLSYGALAEKAASLPVPSEPTLKKPSEYRIIGKPTLRADTPLKINGSAVFGIDVKTEGLLYAVVARCPVFGGKVSRFDAAKAKSLPGVHAVVQIKSGVAVVARSTWEALKARDALEITWDEGPNASLSSAAIHTLLETASAKEGAVAEQAGDAPKILAQGAGKVEAVYNAPFLAHATMEPMNATASVGKNFCEVWAPTQSPQGIQQAAASITGLSEEKIRVHTTFLGGGFGRRFNNDFATEALEISRAVQAPVKVFWSREDDMRHDGYRPVSLHHLSGSVNASGELAAFRHRITAPSIGEQSRPGSVQNGLDKGAVEGAVELSYEIPNFLVEYVMANTPIPIWYGRSVYPSQNVFAVECFIDELAAAAGKDPYEFRRALMKKSPRSLGVLELAAEKAGWGKPLPAGHFHGIAFSPPAFFQTPVAEVAEISVNPDKSIRVHRVTCAIDCGFAVNPETVRAQVEGSVVYGLTAALMGEITIDKGRVVQGSFDDYPLLTIDQMPVVDIHIVESTAAPTGVGEPGLPAIAPAVVNAVFAATGKRIRKLPIVL